MADVLDAVVIAGPRGPGIFAGEGEPPAGFGKDTDLYLDLLAGSLWRRQPLWEEIASALFNAGQVASDGSNIQLALFRAALLIDQLNNTSDLNKPVSTAQQAALDLKAALASPALTGNPTAPTQTAGNNSTRLATTAFVATAIANLIASAPGALDTLDELAAALGDDANFAATVTTALAGKQPLDADLTAIAALATTNFGRGLLALADAAALRTAAGVTDGATLTYASGTVSNSSLSFASNGSFSPSYTSRTMKWERSGGFTKFQLQILWDNNAFNSASGNLIINPNFPGAAGTPVDGAPAIVGLPPKVASTQAGLGLFCHWSTLNGGFILRYLNSSGTYNSVQAGSGDGNMQASVTNNILNLSGTIAVT